MRGERLLCRTIQVRKLKPELLDNRVKPKEWAEALELQLKELGNRSLGRS